MTEELTRRQFARVMTGGAAVLVSAGAVTGPPCASAGTEAAGLSSADEAGNKTAAAEKENRKKTEKKDDKKDAQKEGAADRDIAATGQMVEAYLTIIQTRYPDSHLTPAVLDFIRADIRADLRRSQILRSYPLSNSDEPATVFAAYRSDAG